jgi:flagellar M-ring protein FliF
MIDVNAVEDQMRTSGVQQVSEIVNSHPEEAVAIVRNWIYQDQAR